MRIDGTEAVMKIDASTLPAGAQLEADVAVVGAGPAGIALSLELARAGYRVAPDREGGESFSAAVQRLGDTGTSGIGGYGARSLTICAAGRTSVMRITFVPA
jgi:FAD binding domain